MNARQLLQYLREQQVFVDLEKINVGVLASKEGTEMTLLGVKRLSCNRKNVLVIDVGLDEGEAEGDVPAPEPTLPSELQQQTNPDTFKAIQEALYGSSREHLKLVVGEVVSGASRTTSGAIGQP